MRFHKERSLRIRQTDIELEDEDGDVGPLKINTESPEDETKVDKEKEKTN